MCTEVHDNYNSSKTVVHDGETCSQNKTGMLYYSIWYVSKRKKTKERETAQQQLQFRHKHIYIHWDKQHNFCIRASALLKQKMVYRLIDRCSRVYSWLIQSVVYTPEWHSLSERLFAGEDCFHGLQLLKLNSILFDGPSTFSPLAQFIGQDQALCCLYLQYCSLDAHCTDLLFNALSSVGRLISVCLWEKLSVFATWNTQILSLQ